MKKERHQKYIKEQIEMIKEAIRKDKNNRSENVIFMKWSHKYAKRFRIHWVSNDIKRALHELNRIVERTNGNGCDIIADIKEKLEEAVELLEE